MSSASPIVKGVVVRALPEGWIPSGQQHEVRGDTTIPRDCVRCGNPFLGKAGCSVGLGFACPACAPHFRKRQPCPGCGEMSSRLSRLRGKGPALCDRCRNSHTHVTCSRCRRFRLPAGTLHGRPLCSDCVPGHEKDHSCPGCGATVLGSGSSACVSCYNRERTQESALHLAHSLSRPWAQDAMKAYAVWLAERLPDKPALHKMFERHLPFFQALDDNFPSRRNATGATLLDVLGSTALRKHLLASTFIQAYLGVIVPASARADRAEEETIQRLVLKASTQPYANLIERFGRWLALQPISLRTQRMYLSSAMSACERVGLGRGALPVGRLDRYASVSGAGAKTNLGAFRRFLVSLEEN